MQAMPSHVAAAVACAEVMKEENILANTQKRCVLPPIFVTMVS